MKSISLPSRPDTATLAHLTDCARALDDRQFHQMGYPFDQEVNLRYYYRWLAETGLADVTLIYVGDPYKTEWDMLNTDEFERRVIDFLADSFGFNGSHWGFVTNGGTDGNMHGIYFGRKALAARSPLPPILYVSEEAHYSVKKLGDVQNIETRIIAAQPAGPMDIADFRRQLEPGRPALVAIAIGGTFKGAIDDQAGIAAVLAEIRPPAVYRHLDVALFGGYLPWLEDAEARRILQAEVQHFDSLAVSGHKFLAMNEPAGAFLCRKAVLDDLNAIEVPYLNGAIPTISCSRSGFDPLKLYWRVMTTGAEGFRAQAAHILAMTRLLQRKLADHQVPNWVNPWSNTVCFRRPAPEIVHRYCMACNDCRHFGPLAHVVVMQYFTPELVEQLAGDIAAHQ